MNDFTKEELEELKSCVHWKISAGQQNSLSRLLIGKIQSMIDSYCEHRECHYYEHAPTYKCDFCKKMIVLY